MKTTDVFIEQVLIGFLVLAICAVPVLPHLLDLVRDKSSTAKEIGIGAALVGLSYLIGVVFDRYADSLLEHHERHLRIRFALKQARGLLDREYDPFPEDRLRIQQLRDGSAVAQWFAYLRSTIRLSRALTIFTPGLTLAAVMACHPATPGWRALGYAVLALCYLALPLGWWLIRSTQDDPYSAPRTDKVDKRDAYARVRGIVDGEVPFNRHVVADHLMSASGTLGTVMLGVLIVTAVLARNSAVAIIVLGGCVFTGLAAWSWKKMQTTFMTYLLNLERYK